MCKFYFLFLCKIEWGTQKVVELHPQWGGEFEVEITTTRLV